ncbi:hypothetical protein Zmor_014257 [Zophobas morio]|uniref:Uncharacterized protein n=1 Tax=Zophobas morio TaxID=2755281 RepID=A0AA38MG02_9CUCU|nr:hypothetical protein Zmor_014257 [Zophobas morio]
MKGNAQIITVACWQIFIFWQSTKNCFFALTIPMHNQAAVSPQASAMPSVFADACDSYFKFYFATILHPPRDTRYWLPPAEFTRKTPSTYLALMESGIANKQS